MEYLKLTPDIDSDPAIEAAGWCAARVYELLLKVSALKDKRGRLERQFQAPGWLARRWNLTAADLPGVLPEDLIANGIARLAAVGLIHQDGEDLVLAGWDKYYKPAQSNAERQASFRKKGSVTRNASNESNATSPTPLHPPTPLHVDVAPTPPKSAHVPVVPEKPTAEDASWGSDEFIAYANAKRFEEGLPPDKKFNVREVAAWWSALLMSGYTPRDIRVGFVAFGNDAYWRPRKLPIAGFVSQWERFIEKAEVRHAG